jgi:hypothetical protein
MLRPDAPALFAFSIFRQIALIDVDAHPTATVADVARGRDATPFFDTALVTLTPRHCHDSLSAFFDACRFADTP